MRKKIRKFHRGGGVSGTRIRGGLPRVAMIEIQERKDGGDITARPIIPPSSEDTGDYTIMVKPNRRNGLVGRSPAPGERFLARLEIQHTCQESGTPCYVARIIRKTGEDRRELLGVVRADLDGRYYVDPVDSKSRGGVQIKHDDLLGARENDLVAIILEDHGRQEGGHARISKVYGNIESTRSLPKIAIRVHDIPDTFTHDSLAEARQTEPASLLLGKWEDWREMPFITIDPEDARDHDDAVWAMSDPDPENPDGVVIFVAIADVAHYVRSDGALDQDARIRGNSVYLPGHVVPMLPERISNDLCSLRTHEERPVLAVRMVFDSSGKKKSYSFARAMIRSIAALPYEYAQALIDGHPPQNHSPPQICEIIASLWKAYSIIAQNRDVRTPLDIDLPERKITLGEDGTVKDISIPPRLEAHRLIEEFMIQANVSAAETLQKAGKSTPYRVHDGPSDEKSYALTEFLRSLGLKTTPLTHTSHFNALMRRFKGTEYEFPIQEMVLRTQSQAGYSIVNSGHFGLHLACYTHFTSPIRRYADLIVHRALIDVLKLGDDGLSLWHINEMGNIASAISAAERRAVSAERDTVDRLIADYLSSHINAYFDATVSGIVRSGLFVRLTGIGAEGFVSRDHIGHDEFYHHKRQHALVGVRSRKTYRIGDHVRVRLSSANRFSGSLSFEIANENGKSASLRGRKRKIPMVSGKTAKSSSPLSRKRRGTDS